MLRTAPVCLSHEATRRHHREVNINASNTIVQDLHPHHHSEQTSQTQCFLETVSCSVAQAGARRCLPALSHLGLPRCWTTGVSHCAQPNFTDNTLKMLLQTEFTSFETPKKKPPDVWGFLSSPEAPVSMPWGPVTRAQALGGAPGTLRSSRVEEQDNPVAHLFTPQTLREK